MFDDARYTATSDTLSPRSCNAGAIASCKLTPRVTSTSSRVDLLLVVAVVLVVVVGVCGAEEGLLPSVVVVVLSLLLFSGVVVVVSSSMLNLSVQYSSFIEYWKKCSIQ